MARAVNLLLLFLLFAVVAVLLLSTAGIDVDWSPVMQIVHRDHAVKKHGSDALAVRQSCDNGGRMHLFRSQSYRTPDKFFELCLLDDGRVGLRIREWSKRACDWFERTSFVPGDGSYRAAIEYVTARADEVAGGVLDKYSCD